MTALRFAWPAARLQEAVEALALRAGLRSRHAPNAGARRPGPPEDQPPDRWIVSVGDALGLEVVGSPLTPADFEASPPGGGPTLLELRGEDGRVRFVAVLGGSERGWVVLDPDHALSRRSPGALWAEACEEVLGHAAVAEARLLAAVGARTARSREALPALLREEHRDRIVGRAWTLRAGLDTGFRAQLLQRGLHRLFGALLALRTAEHGLLVGSWWLVGRGILEGRLDHGWLLGWALMLFSLVPLRGAAAWCEGRVAIGFGRVLRRAMLGGALSLRSEEVRSEGAGRLLGRVLEAASVEQYALSGGMQGLTAVVELGFALAVLSVGVGGAPHALALLGWIALTLWVGVRFHRARSRWTDLRVAMTCGLLERIRGRRTRLVQGDPARWHLEEEELMSRYIVAGAPQVRLGGALLSLVSRGWLVCGVLGLAPAFVAGDASATALAASLGGVLLGWRGMRDLGFGTWYLSSALVSWSQVSSLVGAIGRDRNAPPPGPPPALASPGLAHGPPAASDPAGPALLEARGVVFAYPGGRRAVLHGLCLAVHPGDRLLIEGASGSGKTTLGRVLAGLHTPTAGLVLLSGLDRGSWGPDTWHARVAVVPQHHDNHVFTHSLLFNLLVGRRWPATDDDRVEAERVCRLIGLGPLVDRMPRGLDTRVGEDGWSLSQGEQGRVFLARALLQEAEVLILDESLDALDPDTRGRVLRVVERSAATLVVLDGG